MVQIKGMARQEKDIVRNNRGVALLLAVTVISLLVAVTVQFSKDMRQELMSSANLLASGRLGVMAKSGHNLAVAVLAQDGGENNHDSFHDAWAQLGDGDLAQLYGSGRLNITIEDLSGRLQLNSLANSPESRKIFQRLLLAGDYNEMSKENAEMIVDAVVDWIDADDQESGIEETESSYYRSLEPSYSARNGPMEFIEELLLIRGITPDLYYGNDVFPGLRHVVTVHGDDGKININTAPADILQALSIDMTTEMVQNLLDFRQQSENRDLLQDPNWYTTILPNDVTIDSALIGTVGRYFKIQVRAEQGQMTKTLETVVDRQRGTQITMVSRKIE